MLNLPSLFFSNIDILYVYRSKGDDFMQNNNNKDFSEKEFLRNGNKSQDQYAKSSFNTTIKKPGINESGVEAKKRGF
jgi:hypothetical protein